MSLTYLDTYSLTTVPDPHGTVKTVNETPSTDLNQEESPTDLILS